MNAYNGIMGLVVGDALGVPVEFKQRDTYNVTDMIGHGTHNQLPGTWSDDSSMTLATINQCKRDDIKSSDYVVDTLEAALWCLTTTDNYRDCVITAVNLGEDTDTVAAVAGGLAGIVYGCGGKKGIPNEWIAKIPQKDWIKDLCDKLENTFV